MLKRNINLIVKLSLVAILILLVCITSIIVDATSEGILQQNAVITSSEEAISSEELVSSEPLINQPELYPDLNYTVYYEPKETAAYLVEVNNAVKELEHINNSEYTSEASEAMVAELERLKEIEIQMTSDLNHYLAWEEEYYYAAKVWQYFRQRGFNNEVTCAIIGNMMIETAGGTLGLNPNIYSPNGIYYGLCQWSQKYYPETKDLPFEHQLDYLLESMSQEFNTFGKKYKNGFMYEDFLNMTDTEEAALAFAKVYERCGSGSYKPRKKAAIKAYEYFDLERPI